MLADGATIFSYVAIRNDEEYREGYSSKHDSLVIKLPFKEAGIDKAGVLEILDGAGYDGYVALEYEGPEDELAGVPESVDFVRKALKGL